MNTNKDLNSQAGNLHDEQSASSVENQIDFFDSVEHIEEIDNTRAKDNCLKQESIFVIVLFSFVTLILALLSVAIYYDELHDEKSVISNTLNENGYYETFEELNIKSFSTNGRRDNLLTLYKGDNKDKTQDNIQKISCSGPFLPYRYKIVNKGGKLVFRGEDLISENVNYQSFKEDLKNITICAIEEKVKTMREESNRATWTLNSKVKVAP